MWIGSYDKILDFLKLIKQKQFNHNEQVKFMVWLFIKHKSYCLYRFENLPINKNYKFLLCFDKIFEFI